MIAPTNGAVIIVLVPTGRYRPGHHSGGQLLAGTPKTGPTVGIRRAIGRRPGNSLAALGRASLAQQARLRSILA